MRGEGVGEGDGEVVGEQVGQLRCVAQCGGGDVRVLLLFRVGVGVWEGQV